MESSLWLKIPALLALAPEELTSFRVNRFRGEENPVFLTDLHADDQALLKKIYGILNSLFVRLRPVYQQPAECLQTLREGVDEASNEALLQSVQSLGLTGRAEDASPHLRRIFHDLRGGALPGLSMRLQLLDYPTTRPEDAQQVFFLTRDHLKIMRNCIADIDVALREADTHHQDHSLQLLIDKWTSAHLGGKNNIQVEVACHYEGVICESCLEFSTLDRIIYNMMNNATRYAADGRVQFTMLPVPQKDPVNIRFVIANKVLPSQVENLRERFGDDVGELLRGGFTTGGHGLGLRICADFCAQAYGVANFDMALAGGYFGARLQDGLFVIWFHWPLKAD